MAVQGVGHWVVDSNERRLRVIVTGDDRVRVDNLRDEVVAVLRGDHEADLDWQVDQYTQETIGVSLAEDGWEVFSISTDEHENAPGFASSPVYLVRR